MRLGAACGSVSAPLACCLQAVSSDFHSEALSATHVLVISSGTSRNLCHTSFVPLQIWQLLLFQHHLMQEKFPSETSDSQLHNQVIPTEIGTP